MIQLLWNYCDAGNHQHSRVYEWHAYKLHSQRLGKRGESAEPGNRTQNFCQGRYLRSSGEYCEDDTDDISSRQDSLCNKDRPIPHGKGVTGEHNKQCNSKPNTGSSSRLDPRLLSLRQCAVILYNGFLLTIVRCHLQIRYMGAFLEEWTAFKLESCSHDCNKVQK